MDERGKKSNVWSHFDLDVDSRRTKCRLCGIFLSYAGSTTSSMRKHLAYKHPNSNAINVKPLQTTLSNMVSKRCKPVNTWYESATQKAMLICVRDMCPLSLVQGEGFKAFCAALNPNYEVPCPSTIQNYLMKSYEDCRKDLISKLKTKPAVAMTTDMWTSVATHRYITVTAHFLSDWELESRILATRHVEEQHTGKNIAATVQTIHREFGISKVSGITTGNASEMFVAAKEAGYPHILCFAHISQLAVSDGLKLPSIENMLMHARKLVAFFCKSPLAKQILENHQNELGKPPKHVISDVVTRWTSSYFLLERLALLHGDIVAVLHDPMLKKHKHLDLSDNHWILVDHIVAALKPLITATEVLSSMEFPMGSGVYPLLFALTGKHLVVSDLDSNIIARMKQAISDGFSSLLLQDGFLFSPIMVATALDPCYKNLKFLTEEQRQDVQDHVINLIKQAESSLSEDEDLLQVKEEPTSPDSSQPQKKLKFSETEDATTSLLGDIIEIAEVNGDVRTEYFDFLRVPTKLSKASALKSFTLCWWRENAASFPRIARLAVHYLCIPGISVPSDHAFSAASLAMTKQRAALDSDTADAIIFLNKNFKGPLKVAPCQTSTSTSEIAHQSVIEMEDQAEDRTTTSTPFCPSLPVTDID